MTLILLFTSGMLVAENILYIKPYCQTKELRAELYFNETQFEYEENTKDGMCPGDNMPRTFDALIYYTIVTLSTAGFGDISPQSEVG